MQLSKLIVFVAFIATFCPMQSGRGGNENDDDKDVKKHHHHHHKHHKAAVVSASVTVRRAEEPSASHKQDPPLPVGASPVPMTVKAPEIEQKILKIESDIAGKVGNTAELSRGQLEVSTPVPPDFAERFVQAAAQAVGVSPAGIKVISMNPSEQEGVVDLTYEAPNNAVVALQHQAADPSSKLAHGPMRSFLMAKDGGDDEVPAGVAETTATKVVSYPPLKATNAAEPCEHTGDPASIDIDTLMPYGELEPFGREDTAQELTEHSVKESDLMVDQLERAEVAEEKRAVFRALTRLRGAAITSFDGIARSQTGNIDEYNKVHKWRSVHPLHHLADEEADISKWAFPDNAD